MRLAKNRRNIRELGINKEYAGWKDQFRHKFVLSMDGNGATCSRVAVSLHSNCVLMKYDSPHRLYYFDHLIPWRHYIPITSDADVPGLVEAERRQPGLFEWVADEGRSFAREYLSRSSITQFTATLIRGYAASFQHAPELARLSARCFMPTAMPTAESRRWTADQLLEFGGHIQGRGDLWAWPDGWLGEPNTGRAIEAITIVPGADIALHCVEYRAMYGDGVWSEWCRGGSTCGTPGCDRPLKAFCVRLRGEATARVSLTYLATFVDGSRSSLMKAGEICQAKSLAPLEALRINAERVA